MKAIKTSSSNSGFSLIELFVALVIVAILIAIGMPSFNEMISNNRMLAEAQTLTNGLKMARSEAIKRGQAVTICPSTDGKACNTKSSFVQGWLIFIDNTNAGVVDDPKHFSEGGEVIIYHTQLNSDSNVSVELDDITTPYIRFTSQGFLSH